MVAELIQVLRDVDWDLIDLDGMKEVLRNVTKLVQQEMTTSGTKRAGQFNDKHIG